jgi:hypothetical protein
MRLYRYVEEVWVKISQMLANHRARLSMRQEERTSRLDSILVRQITGA